MAINAFLPCLFLSLCLCLCISVSCIAGAGCRIARGGVGGRITAGGINRGNRGDEIDEEGT